MTSVADVFDLSPMPIAVLTMQARNITSAFDDEDPSEIAERHVSRMLAKGTILKGTAAHATAVIAKALKTQPRRARRRLNQRLGVLEQIEALRRAPQEISDLFEDGKTAEIKTRSAYARLAKIDRDPLLKDAIVHAPCHNPVRHGILEIPKNEQDLPSRFLTALREDQRCHLYTEDHERWLAIHIFCRPTISVVYRDAANLVYKNDPKNLAFCSGNAPGFISAHVWAILNAGITHGTSTKQIAVDTQMAARSKRPGTKDIRKLQRLWASAAHARRTGHLRHEDGIILPYDLDENIMVELAAHIQNVCGHLGIDTPKAAEHHFKEILGWAVTGGAGCPQRASF